MPDFASRGAGPFYFERMISWRSMSEKPLKKEQGGLEAFAATYLSARVAHLI